jgi:GTPase SAR1 family protein
MDVSPKDLRGLCDRFRVLIIGRRNAGKTTILEKMTGSEEGAMPEIRDRGRLVVCASFSRMCFIKSRVEYRTGQNLSREAWRFVDWHIHMFSQ